jgi:hypothetical protein
MGTSVTAGVEQRAGSAPGRLSTAQYLAYACGDAANNLTFTLVSMFLLVYYTDVVGIAAGTAGTIAATACAVETAVDAAAAGMAYSAAMARIVSSSTTSTRFEQAPAISIPLSTCSLRL